MFAANANPCELSVEGVQTVEVGKNDITDGREGNVRSRVIRRLIAEMGINFRKYPGPTSSTATNHESIGSCVLEYRLCLLRRIDVAVGDNGNIYSLLDEPDCFELRIAGKFARSRAAMNGHGCDTAVLGNLRNRYTVAGLRAPTGADLQCHRNLCTRDDSIEDTAH